MLRIHSQIPEQSQDLVSWKPQQGATSEQHRILILINSFMSQILFPLADSKHTAFYTEAQEHSNRVYYHITFTVQTASQLTRTADGSGMAWHSTSTGAFSTTSSKEIFPPKKPKNKTDPGLKNIGKVTTTQDRTCDHWIIISKIFTQPLPR